MADEKIAKRDWQTPRGTHDLLPEQEPVWRWVRQVIERRADGLGFGHIETPVFEYPEVFARAIGTATDIVEKEMFSVTRQANDGKTDETVYALRPEGTAAIMRAYIEHGMHTWPQPVRLWYLGQMFRAERPQKGRYRQFWQAGFEIMGDAEATTDALLIHLLWLILGDLGIRDGLVVDINSMGCANCRPKYRKTLLAYYQKEEKNLCPTCQRRLKENPLRLLDCKEPDCQPIKDKAPQIIDHLCAACREHFRIVLESLDELGITYELTPTLVRGFDYYTRTTFEVRDSADTRRQNALGGGGRYDGLLELFGAKSTPAVGFAPGLDRIIERIKEKGVNVPTINQPDLFVVQLGDRAKKTCFNLIAELGDQGLSAICQPTSDSLKGQLRQADKVGVRFALIIGQREALDGTAILRNMEEGTQETVDRTDLPQILRERLSK